MFWQPIKFKRVFQPKDHLSAPFGFRFLPIFIVSIGRSEPLTNFLWCEDVHKIMTILGSPPITFPSRKSRHSSFVSFPAPDKCAAATVASFMLVAVAFGVRDDFSWKALRRARRHFPTRTERGRGSHNILLIPTYSSLRRLLCIFSFLYLFLCNRSQSHIYKSIEQQTVSRRRSTRSVVASWKSAMFGSIGI